jgi:hypothetical protein
MSPWANERCGVRTGDGGDGKKVVRDMITSDLKTGMTRVAA